MLLGNMKEKPLSQTKNTSKISFLNLLKKSERTINLNFLFRILYEDEESMSLIIKDVDASDAGKYTFTAENELGTDTVEMNLTVKGKKLDLLIKSIVTNEVFSKF